MRKKRVKLPPAPASTVSKLRKLLQEAPELQVTYSNPSKYLEETFRPQYQRFLERLKRLADETS